MASILIEREDEVHLNVFVLFLIICNLGRLYGGMGQTIHHILRKKPY